MESSYPAQTSPRPEVEDVLATNQGEYIRGNEGVLDEDCVRARAQNVAGLGQPVPLKFTVGNTSAWENCNPNCAG